MLKYDLNNLYFVDDTIENIFNSIIDVQSDYIVTIVKYLYSIEKNNIIDKKFIRKKLTSIAKNFNNDMLLTDINLIINNVLDFENDINVERFLKAYKSKLIDTVPIIDKTLLNEPKKIIIDNMLKLKDSMLNSKANDIINVLATQRRKLLNGKITVKQAVNNSIKQLAEQPFIIPIKQKNGVVNWGADALFTRQLRNDVLNLANKQTNELLKNGRVNLVEVSSHPTSRPSHADWQGEVFWVYISDPKYRPFSVCGEGEPDGFNGINCRHRKAPFFDEIDQPPKKESYDIKEYEATLQLRLLERNYKKVKQQQLILKESGLPVTELNQKLKANRQAAKNFANKENLTSRI